VIVTLRLAPNAVVDIYRGFNAASPYPVVTTPIAVASVAGHLRHHVRHGRFGHGTSLRWTHVLYLAPDVDIRSAFNSHLNAWQPANADTVLLADYPVAGWCTAFFVVLVQRLNRGETGECLRVCLDRLQPQLGPCPGPGVLRPCCANPLPATLHATLQDISGCPCMDGEVVTLTYDANTGGWSGLKNVCVGVSITMGFSCGSASCADASVAGTFDGQNYGPATVDAGCSCAPLQMVFSGIILGGSTQCPGATVKATITV